MRKIHAVLLLLALTLAACGSTTNNSAPADNNQGGGLGYNQSSAAQSSPVAAGAGANGSTAQGSPAPAGQPAGGTDPVERNDKYQAAPEMKIDPNKTYTATIETTKGTMKAELYAKDAPKTVNNFVFLARDNYYQNIKFHRIIKDFMIQGGDPTGTGSGGPGYEFEDEKVTHEYERGTLAMANAGPNTNGSQFFIVHKDYPLPKQYTIFGKLTEGDDVLDTIANTPTAGREGSTPTEDVRITNVTIEEK